MKYHNDGVLRTRQATTFWSEQDSRKQKLTWMEYVPLIVLCTLMVGVLMNGILY